MRVAVIVLNWNRLEETAACYRSLREQTHKALQIWMVDNGSTAHSEEELREACPEALILRLPENRGFAGGVNAAIRAAQAAAAFDYVWLVNNDATCERATLEQMLQVAARDERTGAVGCEMMEGAPGRERLVAAGKRLRPPLYIPMMVKTAHEVDYLCGASLLIRTETLADVGLLDEEFFFFFEDADWSLRARAKGWRLSILEGPWMRHSGSATIGSLSRLKAAYYRAGHIRLLRKHSRYPWLMAASVAAVRCLLDGLRGNWVAIAGARDGWRKGWQ